MIDMNDLTKPPMHMDQGRHCHRFALLQSKQTPWAKPTSFPKLTVQVDHLQYCFHASPPALPAPARRLVSAEAGADLGPGGRSVDIDDCTCVSGTLLWGC